MKMLMPKRHGFTVVELLVVIVVIGILAAITIVSYLWLNRDAHTAHILVNVSQYAKSIDLYKSKYGQYPTSSTTCIGEYPATSTMPADRCYAYNGAGSSYTTSTTINNELKKVGLQPTAFTKDVLRLYGSGEYRYRGIRYYSPSGQDYYYLYWFLDEGEECGIPGASTHSTTGYTYCSLKTGE